MKNHIKALLVVLILGTAATWAFQHFYLSRLHGNPAPTSAASGNWEVDGIPSFEAKKLDGTTFQLSTLKGKSVIINFWASWCGPCVEEVPSLIKLVKEFKGDVHLVAISGDSSRADIDIFLKSFPELKNENITLIWDEDRSLMQTYGVARLPESVVADRSHKLAKKLVGSIDWYNNDSKAYMKALLEKSAQ